MHDPADAAKARDLITIYDRTLTTPGLDLPFCGPDRATFYFLHRDPEQARAGMAAAERVFSGIFGVTFTSDDVWSSNGTQRHRTAELKSGLFLVLVAKAAHMARLDAAPREMAEAAA